MTSADDNQAVVELLADPLPATVPEVLATQGKLLDLAERWPRKQWDGLASFTYLYRIITKDVLDRLNGGTTFRDPEFLSRLDVEFAKRFFHAVRANAAGQPAPRCWQALFDRRSDERIDPMQFAVAGVNAHVNFDLAFAVVNTCEALPRPLGETERADYDVINDVFAQQMGDLRRHYEDRFTQLLDRVVFDDLADDAGDITVVVARDAAWLRAEHLWTLRGTPAYQREEDAIDWRASMLALGILGFGVI